MVEPSSAIVIDCGKSLNPKSRPTNKEKATDFSTALCLSVPQSSVAVGADADAHAGSAEAHAATVITLLATLNVALAGRVAVGVADNHPAFAALTPAPSVLVADHADIFDIAIR
jgi:hypothetical protein